LLPKASQKAKKPNFPKKIAGMEVRCCESQRKYHTGKLNLLIYRNTEIFLM
jgi:hypothetical protein